MLYREQTFAPRAFHSELKQQTNTVRKARLEPAIRDAQKLAQNVFPPWSPYHCDTASFSGPSRETENHVCIEIFAVVLSLLVCQFVCLFVYLFIYYSYIRFGRLGYLHHWQRREISLNTKTLARLRKASRQKLTRVGWSWSNYLPYKMNGDLRKILSIINNSFIYFKMFVTKLILIQPASSKGYSRRVVWK